MRVRATALGGTFSIEEPRRGRHRHDVGRPSRHLTSVVPQARWDAWPYAERVRRADCECRECAILKRSNRRHASVDRLVVGFDASNAACGPTVTWARAEAAARAVSLRIVSFAVRGPADGTEHIQHSDTLVSYAADADLVVVGACRCPATRRAGSDAALLTGRPEGVHVLWWSCAATPASRCSGSWSASTTSPGPKLPSIGLLTRRVLRHRRTGCGPRLAATGRTQRFDPQQRSREDLTPDVSSISPWAGAPNAPAGEHVVS